MISEEILKKYKAYQNYGFKKGRNCDFIQN
jgi:hypothetical protein